MSFSAFQVFEAIFMNYSYMKINKIKLNVIKVIFFRINLAEETDPLVYSGGDADRTMLRQQ